jgi:hypothetical protein
MDLCHGQVADLAIVITKTQKEKAQTRQPEFFTISEIVHMHGILVNGINFFSGSLTPPDFLVYIPGVYEPEKYGSPLLYYRLNPSSSSAPSVSTRLKSIQERQDMLVWVVNRESTLAVKRNMSRGKNSGPRCVFHARNWFPSSSGAVKEVGIRFILLDGQKRRRRGYLSCLYCRE